MEIDMKPYFTAMRTKLWLIVLVAVLFAAAAWGLSRYYITPQYSASAKLVVTKTVDANGTAQLDINTMMLNIKLIDTYKYLIVSAAILDPAAKRVPDLNLTAAQLAKKVKVHAEKETAVLSIAVNDDSYSSADRIIEAVSSEFKNQIQSIMKVDNVVILREDVTPSNPKPVSPNVNMNTAAAFVAGLLVAGAAVIAGNHLNDTVRSEEDIESLLGTPTLAVVPKAKRKDVAAARSKKIGTKVGETSNVSVN